MKEKELTKDTLYALFSRNKKLNIKQIARLLSLNAEQSQQAQELLGELCQEGKLRHKTKKWFLPKRYAELLCTYTLGRGGRVYAIPVNPEDEAAYQIRHPIQLYLEWDLFPGDVIQVQVELDIAGAVCTDEKGECFGKILSLVESTQAPFAAQICGVDDAAWRPVLAVPLEFMERHDVEYTLPGVPDGVHDEDICLVRVTQRDLETRQYTLAVSEVLSDFSSVATQERLVKSTHAVPMEFPPTVMEEAQALPSRPARKDILGRRDLREYPFVTIDGDTAKDFDDAIQVERSASGWLLRVAIADVSHYVRPHSAMDTEALARGNSWYFPTSVEPMLPVELSNGLCSLNPKVNRLVMWAEIAFSEDGIPGETAFGCGVIRSRARLTYDGVKAAFLDQDPAAMEKLTRACEEPERVQAMLEDALALFHVLYRARMKRGGLDFDLPDTEALVGRTGKLKLLRRAERHDVHRMIEEFMIAANEAVARRLEAAGVDALYRIHPQPSPDRLEELVPALRACGIGVPYKEKKIDFQSIIEKARGTKADFVVNRLCVRSMQQARYARLNVGHFGLASDAYCHFTSPIRRYADLLVHRALKHVLGIDGGEFPTGEALDSVANQINDCEKRSNECEREMNKRLACLWMRKYVLKKPLKGLVSGVKSFGCFVELADVPVEGLIPIRDLGASWYTYDPDRQTLFGEEEHDLWKIGRPCEVVCLGVNLVSLRIDFEPRREFEFMRAMARSYRRRGRHR